jgi:hypothetical protein
MNGSAYNLVRLAADRASAARKALREAERDFEPYAPHLAGMAFDSAEEAYCKALIDLGVAEDEVKDLPLAALKIVLKHQGIPGVVRHARARTLGASVASKASGALAFLNDIPAPGRLY